PLAEDPFRALDVERRGVTHRLDAADHLSAGALGLTGAGEGVDDPRRVGVAAWSGLRARADLHASAASDVVRRAAEVQGLRLLVVLEEVSLVDVRDAPLDVEGDLRDRRRAVDRAQLHAR